MVRPPVAVVAAALALMTIGGCGGGGSVSGGSGTAEPAGNAADLTFLQDMLPHHMQAVAAGQLAATQGTDPRVTAFGQRIIREQTPEIARMRAMVKTLGLRLDDADGQAMAVNRITPAELRTLAAEPAGTRDHDLMARSAVSELGAVDMAKIELGSGTYKPALTLAASIASAGNPGSEIAQLQTLAGQLNH